MWSKMTDEYVQSDGTLQKVSKWRPVNKEGSFNDLVRGITPNTIAYRNRSCFCYPYRNSYGSQCLHDEICGSWKVFKLQKQNVVQSQSNLEDSLDVSPICSNSKAQTIFFTHQKYIVNSCVIVKYGEIFYPDCLPLQMTDNELANYPQFSSLLSCLQDRLAPDGSSLKMKSALDEVQHSLSQARLKWLMSHTVYLELYELLASYEIKSHEGTLTPDEKQIQMCLTKTLSYNEIGDYLHFHPGVNSKSTLFGLTQMDIDQHNPAKHLLNDLQKIIIPMIEDKIQKKCEDLYNFYEPVKATQQGSAATKFLTLPDLVEHKLLSLQQEKETLKKDRVAREQHFWTYYQKLLECLSVIETIVKEYKLTCQAQTDDVTVEWLETRSEALRLKVKLTQVQILCDTYTNEAVKALKKIRGHLDDAIKQTEAQLAATTYSLQSYHSIGAEFKSLVNQFTLLQNEIENRKWALSTMGRTLNSTDGLSHTASSSPRSVDSLLNLVSPPVSQLKTDLQSQPAVVHPSSKSHQSEKETKKVSFLSPSSSQNSTT
ncbi:HAUS augmin complex subunit 4 [Biomphalaria glabrata]|nr:HAUS augmin complex subunit 4 [Biomphalaria glabrata]